MTRSRAARRLNLWMNGLPVGYWEIGHAGDELHYWQSWLDDEQGRPLSLSLPFRPGNAGHRCAVVSSFFDNALPDRDVILRRLAVRYKTGGIDAYSLLSAVGRDCVGAIQILPPDEEPVDVESIRQSNTRRW